MPTPKLTLASEVKYLKGVGPARAEILASRGIRTVEDLLYYSPFRYEDRTRLTPIRDLVPGQTTTVLANVLACGLLRTRRGLHIYDLAPRIPAACSGANGSTPFTWKGKKSSGRASAFSFTAKLNLTLSAPETCRWCSPSLKSLRSRKRGGRSRWRWDASSPFTNRWGSSGLAFSGD